MLVKTLVAPVALTLSLTVSSIYATPWAITATGTISDGYDFIGLFGAANQNLAGDPYTLTITTDPNLNANSYSIPGWGNSTTGGTSYGYYGAPITVTAIVNGISITDIINPNISGISPGQNIQAVWDTPSFNSLQSANQGYTQDIDSYIIADLYVRSTNSFLSSASFDQSLTYTIQPSDLGELNWAYESVINGQFTGISSFNSGPTLISINPSNTPIPIPPTILLVGSGLVGLFGFARRKPT